MLRAEKGGCAGCGESGLGPCLGGSRANWMECLRWPVGEFRGTIGRFRRGMGILMRVARLRFGSSLVCMGLIDLPLALRGLPAPASPSLSCQVPPPTILPVQLPPLNSPPSLVALTPQVAPVNYDHLAYDELRAPRRQCGYVRTD